MLEEQAILKSLIKYHQAMGIEANAVDTALNWLEISPDFFLKPANVEPKIPPVSEKSLLPVHNVPNLEMCESLTQLTEMVAQLDDFSIKRTAMNFVFATGPASADIMLVSEFPNESDDQLGQAYTGSIGEMVHKMMHAIGQEFNQIYATYLLPWRPPGNRSPSKKETRFFGQVLKKHIALKKPKYLLLMGNAVLKGIMADHDVNLNAYRGKCMTYECPYRHMSQPFYVTYSPMHLQKFLEYKKRAWEDLQFFRSQL